MPARDLPADEQWWFNLRTQQVECGLGDANSERLGPYATSEEAAGAVARMRARAADQDREDD